MQLCIFFSLNIYLEMFPLSLESLCSNHLKRIIILTTYESFTWEAEKKRERNQSTTLVLELGSSGMQMAALSLELFAQRYDNHF